MIQLNKQYRLDNSKDHEVTLQQLKMVEITIDRKPTGKTREQWVDLGYYTKLEAAFNAFLNRYVSKGNSVTEVLERIAEVKQIFKNTLNLNTCRPEVNLNREE